MKPRQPLMLVLSLSAGAASAFAQHSIASVPTAEATVSDPLKTSGLNTVLGLASDVSASDRPAHLTLERGGTLLVCQASSIRLAADQSLATAATKEVSDPLLLTLKRGAIELAMLILPADTITTPEMRVESASYASKAIPIDLAIAVSADGDTCIESRNSAAPPLKITDVFSSSTYKLKPGQHILFRHGMVEQATLEDKSFCGCPTATQPGLTVADAALRYGTSTAPLSDNRAATFPFPTAASQGLESPRHAPVDVPTSGNLPAGAQLANEATLTFDPNPAPESSFPKPAPATPALVLTPPPPAPAPSPARSPTPAAVQPAPPKPAPSPGPKAEPKPETSPAPPSSAPPAAQPKADPPRPVIILPAPSPTPKPAMTPSSTRPAPAPAASRPAPAQPASNAIPQFKPAEPIYVYAPPSTAVAHSTPEPPKPAAKPESKPASKSRPTPKPKPASPAAPSPAEKPQPSPSTATPKATPPAAPKPQTANPLTHNAVFSTTRTVGISIGHFFKKIFTR